MARPRSEEKRSAITAAAIRIIATHGLAAPTASIAKDAGVSNGSLFTYFETKSQLFSELYLELKSEMALTAMADLPLHSDLREQMLHMWRNWLYWAVSFPEKRRALAHLGVSDQITQDSRERGHRTMAGIAALLEQCRQDGPMKDTPIVFIANLASAMADATTDFMIADPANAKTHCMATFEALWRMVR